MVNLVHILPFQPRTTSVISLGRIPALLPYHIGLNPCFPKNASGWSIGIELVCTKGSVGINSTKRLMTTNILLHFVSDVNLLMGSIVLGRATDTEAIYNLAPDTIHPLLPCLNLQVTYLAYS